MLDGKFLECDEHRKKKIFCTHRGNNKLWNNGKKNNFSYTNKKFSFIPSLLLRLSFGNKSFLVTFLNNFLIFQRKTSMEFKWYFILLCCTFVVDLRELFKQCARFIRKKNVNGFGMIFASSTKWKMHFQIEVRRLRHNSNCESKTLLISWNFVKTLIFASVETILKCWF